MTASMKRLRSSPAMLFIYKCLSLFGFWPLDYCDLNLPPLEYFFRKALGIVNMVVVLTVLVDNEILLYFLYEDIPEFTDQLALVCTGLLCITRLVSVVTNPDACVKFLENFIDNIMMTPLNTRKENTEKYKIMRESEMISKYLVYFLFFTITFTMTTFEFAPPVTHILFGTEMRHPFRLLIPFEIDTMASPSFEIIYYMHIICGYGTIVIVTAYDCIFHISIVYVLGQFKYLGYQVRNIVAHAKENLAVRNIIPNEGNVDKEVLRLLSKYVEKHNMLLSFLNELNDLVNFPFFVELGAINILLVCLCGFQIIIADTSLEQTSRYCFYYISAVSVTFFTCFLGQQLVNGGVEFCEAVYDCEWYLGCSTNCGKSIAIMLMRTQKPLTIQAGKIIDLSLETFTDLMKSSMSFFTMLQTVYE